MGAARGGGRPGGAWRGGGGCRGGRRGPQRLGGGSQGSAGAVWVRECCRDFSARLWASDCPTDRRGDLEGLWWWAPNLHRGSEGWEGWKMVPMGIS